MKIRQLDIEKDFDSLLRLWKEIGWLGDKEKDKEALKYFQKDSDSYVAEVNSNIEAYVNSTPGTIQYLDDELKLQAITAVMASRTVRKQGFASKITAKMIADRALAGEQVACLGMFEQGFYNKLGFGTGSYENMFRFDPSHLQVDYKPASPERLSIKDWKEIHRALLNRKKVHGYCSLLPAAKIRSELNFTRDKGFGLGYRTNNGKLKHFIWFYPDDIEMGPYHVSWMVYNSRNEFLELIALLKSLVDQVHLIKLVEPGDIQFQDLIKKPIKNQKVRKKSKFNTGNEALAYWQIRILNLKDCIEKVRYSKKIEFNLDLSDPIEKYLSKGYDWNGLSGNYIIKLHKDSRVKRGYDENLPVLKSSVNAFSRLWLGVKPASGLSYTDNLKGPENLLKKLDQVFNYPVPKRNWEF